MRFILIAITIFSHMSFSEDLFRDYRRLNEIRIEIVNVNDIDKMKFVFCSRTYEDEDFRCRDLSHNTYTKRELKKLLRKEKIEAHLKTVGVAVGAVIAGILIYKGAAVIGSAASGSGYAIFRILKSGVGKKALALIAGTASSPLWWKKISPIRQHRQANVFRRHNFIDYNVISSEEDVLRAADILSDIL